MERDELLARLQKVIVEHVCTDPEKVVESASLEQDLGLDSLDNIEIGMALEEEFGLYPAGVELATDEQIRGCKTVGDFIPLLEAALA